MTEIIQHQYPNGPSTNPLLVRARIPGRTFALPSRGVFYTNDELTDDVNDGEVLVNPMVTMDELAMKTPDKILNGTALAEVFVRCVPQVKKPFELLSVDVDFLMVALREVTYGPEFELSYQHTCKDAAEHSYVVNLGSIIAECSRINVATIDTDYTIKLPNEQVIKISPPRYRQMLSFYQSFGNRNRTDEPQSEVAQSLLNQIIETTTSIIVSVDGITDKPSIREWLQVIPAGYVNQITDRVSEVGGWGPKLTREIICKDCNETVEITIPMNPMNFFS